jgi:ATP adenylyltransferase
MARAKSRSRPRSGGPGGAAREVKAGEAGGRPRQGVNAARAPASGRSGSRARRGSGVSGAKSPSSVPAKPPRSTSRSGSISRSAAVEQRKPLRLWAPWRMELVESQKPEGCIFCQFFAAAGEESDRQNLVVHRAPLCFTMLNRYPYNSGHVMVVPRSHVANLEDLPGDEYEALHDELKTALRVMRRTYRPDGMNVGMNLGVIAGAGIAEHLHYHVVPRWAGDTSFMPVLAEVRVIVQHLDDAWRRIHAGFSGA